MLHLAELAGPSTRPLRVIVADRFALFRRGLIELLRSSMPGSELAEAADLQEAARILQHFPAEVVLADLDNEVGDLRECLDELSSVRPGVKVAALTGGNNRDAAFAWLQAGAHGCVPKSATLEELCDALRTIRAGHGYVSSAILASPAPGRAGADNRPAEATAQLTARQQDVLHLLAEGRPTKDIARRLGLSVSTVKAHLGAAYRSLGAHNRVEALMRCRGAGQVPLGKQAAAVSVLEFRGAGKRPVAQKLAVIRTTV